MHYRIEIRPYGASYQCAPDESLLNGASACGLHLFSNCQRGECGTCKVKIRSGQIKLEPFMLSALSMAEIEADYTLACRSYPLSDVVIVAEVVGRIEPRHYERKSD